MKDLSKKQLEFLKLTISSGSPQHPFIRALSNLLDGDAERKDADLVIEHVRSEPHWEERNRALCDLLGVKLEDVAPPPPPKPTLEAVMSDNKVLRSQVLELQRRLAEVATANDEDGEDPPKSKAQPGQLPPPVVPSDSPKPPKK